MSFKLPSVTIFVKNKKYLTRTYLFLKDRVLFNMYDHVFHSSDAKGPLHSHPWRWGLSFVYRGGYHEERRVQRRDGRFVTRWRTVKAPAFNFISNKDFHRVELLDEEKGCHTLFFAGPRDRTWEFWDPKTNRTYPWHENPEAIP